MVEKIFKTLANYHLAQNIFATATFKQSSITFAGTVLNGVLGAVFYIITARYLGPADFGLMSVSIAVLTLIADIGDLGTDTGLVNFVAKYIKKNKKKAFRFLKLGLEIKVIVGITVLVLGLFLAPLLAEGLFKKTELTPALFIAFGGVLSVLLFSFVIHILQVYQRFWAWSGIQVGTNAFRILVLLVLLLYSKVDLKNSLIVYITMPMLGFLVGFALLPRGFYRVERESSVAKEFFHYNKWVAALTLLTAFSSRLDTFLSARLLASSDLGLYSAANQLVKIVPQLVTALGTVVAPKMAGMGERKDFISYFKKVQLMVAVFCLFGLLSIPIVSFLIPVLYGPEYLASVPLFVVLLLAMLVFLFSVPVHNAVFYYFSYPKLFFWLALGHLVIIAGLGWQLINLFGAMGAAITVLVGAVFNFVIPAVWLFTRIKK